MQRILDPGQIEAFAERSLPRVRMPESGSLFARRAQRLRALGQGHALQDYLLLMAAVAEGQQAALDGLLSSLRAEQFAQQLDRQIELAHEHRMPLLQASGWPRQRRWRDILLRLCDGVAATPGFPPGVRSVCDKILSSPEAWIEAQANLLTGNGSAGGGLDASVAPFLMAALQVYWVGMAAALPIGDVRPIDVRGVCPLCGTLPVASIVRSDKHSPGYRYLHCGLCATEWHLVRITCSHCLANEGIQYHAIEGGSEAVRAESCGQCLTYRKILYQEKDPEGEPVADDLASLALDLLMTEAGFHRASGNPLLWQAPEE
jgi:FdhE protein